MAHVIVTEDLVDHRFVAERCDPADFAEWAEFVALAENSPEAMELHTGVPAAEVRAAARLYATGGNGAIYYGLGVTEHSQGSTMVMGMANLAMATGNLGRDGVGVNPLRGQNNVQGSCDMGSFPHELSGYRHVSDEGTRAMFEALWGHAIQSEPGLRIPNMFDAAIDGHFKGLFVQGEDIAQSDPNTVHVMTALRSLELLVVQDLFVNETAKFAHVFLPGTSFLEKDGTFTNAERRINRVRPVMRSRSGKQEWEVVCELAAALGAPMHYRPGERRSWTRSPRSPRRSPACRSPSSTRSAACSGRATRNGRWARRSCTRHVRARPRQVHRDAVRGHRRAVEPTVPAAAHHRPDPQPVQRRRADPAHRQRPVAPRGHPRDPSARRRGARHRRRRRGHAGQSGRRHHAARAISDRMPQGVVYTTFHHPVSGANVVTTEWSDWATNCPEYKVTAVQVSPGHSVATVELDHPEHRLGALVRMANQIARQFTHEPPTSQS